MKAAADVIAHAAERHRAQRLGRHRQRRARAPVRACSRRSSSSSDGRGNFGASPKPPSRPIERRLRTARPLRPAPRRPRRSIPPARGRRRPSTDRSRSNSSAAAIVHARAIVLPDARELAEQVEEPRPAPSRRRRKIGAAEKRLELRRQEDRHRPSAGSGRRLHERHVDAVDVRPLLAVDLDRHEAGVERVGDRRVLERLVLHHVAPVTGRVANRQEDRLVLALAPCRTPRRPTDTSRPDCWRAAEGTGCARARDGSSEPC